ncbi:Rid family hydrolase [Nocardiopsis sp. NPDC007018]|uniref:RidA family protein n=1 Tax=Nocardiopsis sp. NPDC007018 TaxID=3155721 RepID=UPI0033EEAE1D
MTVQLLSPEGLFQPVPYHHVAIGTGSRQVHVAGQIARDGDSNRLATGDLTGQVEIVLRHTASGLAAAGATFDDVVRLRFFAVGWKPEKADAFMKGIENVTEELRLPTPLPPVSLIGVDYLWEPDVLVELEAFAVLD